MRAKMTLHTITKHSGDKQESLRFNAVSGSEYGPNGESEDNTYARYTPMAELTMTVTNPALVGQFKQGESYYVDFTPVE